MKKFDSNCWNEYCQRARNKKIRAAIRKAHQKLEERKVIEKAKGVLMIENNITEEEAYNMIRNLSMDKRCPMMEIAETIVMSDD